MDVGKWKLKEVFNQKLSIPSFQRPYAWEEKHVIQLVEDLLNAKKENKVYLIGNMILYKENEKFQIIDGQQRITTLALLFKVLGEEVNFLNNEINPLSIKRLKKNYKILENYFKNYQEKDFLEFIKEKVIITYMQTDDLDEAFVLFDSQNTRGKPLKRKDILKVHHIHPIKRRRKIFARKWEEWEKEKISSNIDRLDELLYNLALIRRAIRGELKADDLIGIDVFKEFFAKISSYKLNNYNQPPIYEEYIFDFENDLLEIITRALQFKNRFIYKGHKFLPFEVNSSIARGDMFFEYVYKYFNLYKEVLKNKWYQKLDRVSGSGNIYLQKIYKSLIFYYMDKFREEKLKEFAQLVLLILAYFRLMKKSVRADGVVKFIWNNTNKLDIFRLITLSYSVEEVIDSLNEYIKFKIDKEVFENKYKNTKANFIQNIKELINEYYR